VPNLGLSYIHYGVLKLYNRKAHGIVEEEGHVAPELGLGPIGPASGSHGPEPAGCWGSKQQ
jgi:hypothetical protein